MTAQYALKCLIPESNPRALPLWMSTLPESGCKDNKKSRLCKRTTAYILYLVRCICLSHRLFPKLRPSEDSLFCCFWSGRRGSNSRPQPWQGCALPTELLPHFSVWDCKGTNKIETSKFFLQKKRIFFRFSQKHPLEAAQNTPLFVLTPLQNALLSTKHPSFCSEHLSKPLP